MQSVRIFVSKLTAGFTLIELMIVVAVVGILATIAYPAYQQQVRESRRPEAHAALTAMANDLEKFRSECGSYPSATFSGTTGITGARNTCTGLGRANALSTNQNYSLGLTNATAEGSPPGGYLLRAVAQGQQAADTDCRTFTLSSTGATGATDAGGSSGANTARCWRR